MLYTTKERTRQQRAGNPRDTVTITASNGESANEAMPREYQTSSSSSASNSKHEPLSPANASDNCDRKFLKSFPPTVSSVVLPSNFCVPSTTYSRLNQ